MRSVSAQLSGSEGHINRFCNRDTHHSTGLPLNGMSLDNSSSNIFLVVPQGNDAGDVQSLASSNLSGVAPTREVKALVHLRTSTAAERIPPSKGSCGSDKEAM